MRNSMAKWQWCDDNNDDDANDDDYDGNTS